MANSFSSIVLVDFLIVSGLLLTCNQEMQIFCKVKAIEGLRGGVAAPRRTRNPEDQHRDCGKVAFPLLF
jgi:hypothetical protein